MGLSLPLEPIHKTEPVRRLVVEVLRYAGWVLAIFPVYVLERSNPEIKQHVLCMYSTYMYMYISIHL